MSRRRRRVVVAFAAIAALVLVGTMAREVGRRGRFAVPLSSYSTARGGTKALTLLARASGRDVRPWTRDLTHLPARGGVLLAAGANTDEPELPLTHAEEVALLRWVERGGVVVVLGARGYLPESFGVLLTDPEEMVKLTTGADPHGRPMPWNDPELLARLARRDQTVDALFAPRGLGQGLQQLRLVAPDHIKVTEGDWSRIATSPKDDLVIVRAMGRGHVAVVASASFVTNQALTAGDHAALATRLLALGEGPVLVDEHHLGMGSSDSLATYVREHGLTFAAAQLLLVVLLAGWRTGARFGGARPPPPTPAADVTSYVDAAGQIYARAGDVRASMQRLATHALGRIAARHGVRGTDAKALGEALRARGRAAAASAVEAVATRLSAATSTTGRAASSPADLVEFTRGLDADVAPALAPASPTSHASPAQDLPMPEAPR